MKSRRFTNVLKILVLVVTLIAFSVQSTARQYRSINPALVARAQQITGDNFSVVTTTPQGVTVLARTMPSHDFLNAIDGGFAALFEVAQRHGYHSRMRFEDYTVFIARADRTKDSQGQYSPDIAVPAQQYAGTDYDQGGFIYAAGMVLAFNPCALVIAEHDRDLPRVSNVVRFEGEHLVLFYNDRALYQRTADHSRGGGHPILQ
ncbi:MAG: hypothetical protein QOH70_2118 [Blastocatellia bacterium]|jgi:hypothetical protein|nr:hypothetical protein [Blastocatellia bacterium]